MHPELLRTAGLPSTAGQMALAAALLLFVVAVAALFFWIDAKLDGKRASSREARTETSSK